MTLLPLHLVVNWPVFTILLKRSTEDILLNVYTNRTWIELLVIGGLKLTLLINLYFTFKHYIFYIN